MRLRRSHLLLAAFATLAAFAACRSTGGDTSGGGGTGACGGVMCDLDHFCMMLPCGEGLPECTPIPTSCPADGPQVCGDDGMVYPNACMAAQAGQGLGGSCALPPGTFTCGSFFCDPQREFCQTAESSCGPPTLRCQPYPSSCGTPPPTSCDCLGGNVACQAGHVIDSTCTQSGPEFAVYCPQ